MVLHCINNFKTSKYIGNYVDLAAHRAYKN